MVRLTLMDMLEMMAKIMEKEATVKVRILIDAATTEKAKANLMVIKANRMMMKVTSSTIPPKMTMRTEAAVGKARVKITRTIQSLISMALRSTLTKTWAMVKVKAMIVTVTLTKTLMLTKMPQKTTIPTAVAADA